MKNLVPLFILLINFTITTAQEVMHVKGKNLYDPNGEQVVLRGVNEMFIWSDNPTGDKILPEIAKTGSNVVRIVWLPLKDNENATPENLDKVITNCIRNKMFPMPELHGATGKWDKLQEQVDYWTNPEVVKVLKKHEPYLLLNIANEVGDHSIKAEEFQAGYQKAVDRIRATGLKCPLIIDASGWGQDLDILLETGPSLIDHDPEHNLMLSVHMWWVADDGSTDRIKTGIAEAISMDLPLLIGEFAPMGVGCKRSIDYKTIMAEAQKHQVGWIAWSWGHARNGDCSEMDMTAGENRGKYSGLYDWGREVALTGTNSIANTSVKTNYLLQVKPGGEVVEKTNQELWKKQIENVRKGELIIHANPGAEITVKQLNHEFWFGAAISNSIFDGSASTEDVEQYKKMFLKNFNSAVTENAVKWGN
ncbi:MAG: cellulase family glycosylhydrolase, partial [Bacteroidota bacterium]